ncbi:MAG: hypothetical protein P1U56_23375 [Saprospiraceae bacterium]|nr:hypothetical protein [Saprospiraceae bacterium]
MPKYIALIDLEKTSIPEISRELSNLGIIVFKAFPKLGIVYIKTKTDITIDIHSAFINLELFGKVFKASEEE